MNGYASSFREYLDNSRLLQFGFAFNLVSLSSVILAFTILWITGNLETTAYAMDFQVFYEAGRAFLISPDSIYTVNPNGLPFRYFPIFAGAMSLFTVLPLYPLYLANIIAMTIFHLGTVYLIYRICLQLDVTTSTKNFEKTLTIVAITPPHVVNLILGQTSQFVILLLLIALLLLLSTSNESWKPFVWIGLIIGIASTLKPFCLVFMPFLIPFTLGGRLRLTVPIRRLGGVFVGLLLSMMPNLIYFAFYPTTLNEFLNVNFVEGLSFHHSTSITRLVSALIPLADPNMVEFSIMLVLGGFIFLRSFLRFVRSPEEAKDYLHHFADMMFLVLLVYPDSWFLFLAFLYAFLGPSMLNLYASDLLPENNIRYVDILWHGANNLLAFFPLGIALHYLVLGFDPINPIWIAILYLLYHRGTKAS